MNTKNNKGRIIIISVILAVVLSALFLVVKATTLFITAYIIAIFGITLFCIGNLYLLKSIKSYPWFAIFPITIFRYLLFQVALSTIFIILETIPIFSINIQWFLLLHIVLFAFFAIVLILQKGGKEIIENRDETINKKVVVLQLMRSDIESLIRKYPEHERDFKEVADALRYSDPMSHSSLIKCEEQIQQGILSLNDGKNITEQCMELLRQIADRNSQVKILK